MFEVIGKGKPLVLVPGLFAGSWMWKNNIDAFVNAGYACYVIQEPISISFNKGFDHARNVIFEILEHSNSEKVSLIGNSLGALIVMDFAARHPESCEGIVVSGTSSKKGNGGFNKVVSMDTIRQKGFGETLRKIGTAMFHDESVLPWDEYNLEIEKLASVTGYRNVVRWLVWMRKFDVEKIFSNINVPILLVWGNNDTITPASDWREQSDKNSFSEMVILEQCNHCPMLEQPELFNDAVVSHFSNDIPEVEMNHSIEVRSRINRILKKYYEVEIDENHIAKGSSISEILEDSLSMLEMVMAIEDEFDIRVQDEELAGIKTIDDIYALAFAETLAEAV